jgi:hypothetical protein
MKMQALVILLMLPLLFQTARGTLVFTIKGQVRYTEGAIVHVTISRMEKVAEEFEFRSATPGNPQTARGNTRTLSLPPGDYTLTTYVLPLFPGPSPRRAQDRCDATFSLREGGTLYITRVQTRSSSGDGGPCTIEISGTKP